MLITLKPKVKLQLLKASKRVTYISLSDRIEHLKLCFTQLRLNLLRHFETSSSPDRNTMFLYTFVFILFCINDIFESFRYYLLAKQLNMWRTTAAEFGPMLRSRTVEKVTTYRIFENFGNIQICFLGFFYCKDFFVTSYYIVFNMHNNLNAFITTM